MKKGIRELKAKLITKGQEIKRLKKQLRQTKEVHKSILNDYHEVEDYLKKELDLTKAALAESQRKKWYQFKQVEWI